MSHGQEGPARPKERRARTRNGARGAPSSPGGRPLLAMSHEPIAEYTAKN